MESCKRLIIVWGSYISSSIKESTRERRGKGIRRKVAGKTKLPGKWADFSCDSCNKQELFTFLSNKVVTLNFPESKEVIVTTDNTAVVRGAYRPMLQCDHEEADTRQVIHLQDSLINGCTSCLVCMVDTDMVVILVGMFHHFVALCREVNIWVAIGSGKKFIYYHINRIYESLGMNKSLALPVFHCFTGCDTTSAFFGRGKKASWEVWKCYAPTQDALLQHTKCVAYQAGIWCSSNQSMLNAPSPEGWGWTITEEKTYIPVWSTLPLASKACSKVVKCACKNASGCGTRCACKKARWNCTELCKRHCLTPD